MKRFACALALGVMILAAPVLARADVFSWSTPIGSGSFDTADITQGGSATGSGTIGVQTYSWGYSWALGAQTADVSASVGDDAYAFSFSWANLFSLLFGW